MSAFDMVFVSGRLHYFGRAMPATCGRGGVCDDKREGDGATPPWRFAHCCGYVPP